MWYERVKEFHQTFGHPVGDGPTLLSEERAAARLSWMQEELDEFADARKTMAPLLEQADAMIDLIYFALGTLVELGVDPAPLFDIVHSANMAKVHPDGTVKYHPDGKVKKPEGWEPPDEKIAKEIDNQIKGVIYGAQ